MRKSAIFGLFAVLAALPIVPAKALCSYHGELYARTTVEQEFRDSRWVGRARVVSGDYHWSDSGESWTLYRLEAIETFKGKLPKRFTFFTERNSGGFYMDGKTDAVPDLGAEYLLFLQPTPHPNVAPEAKGALRVNYECGQSRRWSEVSSREDGLLRKLGRP